MNLIAFLHFSRTPLLRPKSYFEPHLYPLAPALGVFTVYVIATLVTIYALVSLLLVQIQDGTAGLERAMYDYLGTVILVYLVIAFVALLLVAAILHFLSGGETDGTFGDAVAIAGWAYAPDVIVLPIIYLDARREISQLSFDGSDPQVLATQFEAIEDPTGIVPLLITLCVVVWSVYILAKGTAGTHVVDVAKTLWPGLLVGFGPLLFALL